MADAVLEVIETLIGEGSLCIVVDLMTGSEAPRTINQLTDQVQMQLLTWLGLADRLTVASAPRTMTRASILTRGDRYSERLFH